MVNACASLGDMNNYRGKERQRGAPFAVIIYIRPASKRRQKRGDCLMAIVYSRVNPLPMSFYYRTCLPVNRRKYLNEPTGNIGGLPECFDGNAHGVG
jgi:hypothetical protein